MNADQRGYKQALEDSSSSAGFLWMGFDALPHGRATAPVIDQKCGEKS